MLFITILLALILFVLVLSYLEQTGRAYRMSKAIKRKFKK